MRASDLEQYSELFNVKTKEERIIGETAEDLTLKERETNGFNSMLEYLKPLLNDEEFGNNIDLILENDPELKEKVETKLDLILEKRKSRIKS